MKANIPSVFVASTFFDLAEIRAAIARFVESELGYLCLISENASFPVDATVDAIENCRQRVESDADVFVLLVGTRYGFVIDRSRTSVTRMEYLTARAKGIPTFVFVHEEVLNLARLISESAELEISDDSLAAAKFVSELRDDHKTWTFAFRTEGEIITQLRKQLASTVAQALRLTAAMRSIPELGRLRNEAFRLAVEQPLAWQGLLIAAIVRDEVAAAADTRREYEAGIVVGAGERVSNAEMAAWLGAYTFEARRMVEALTHIVNDLLNRAAKTTDIASLDHGSRQIGKIYTGALNWANRLRAAYVPERWRNLIREKSLWLQDVVERIETFPDRFTEALMNAAEGDWSGQRVVEFSFSVKLFNMERYQAEMSSLLAAFDDD